MSPFKNYLRRVFTLKGIVWLAPTLSVGAVAALLFLTTARSSRAQVTPTTTSTVTLSCNDGHSVIFQAGQTEVTSLLAEVQAINASGTGTTCTLSAAPVDPASSETTEWTVYDYNSSDRAIAPRNSPNSKPAMPSNGGMTWTFPFLANTFTALFTTTDPKMTGDLSTATLSDMINVSGDASIFMTQHNGGDCFSNTPAAVRFYFTSPSASGSSVGTPPAGFYTRFWWSNPMNMPLTGGNQSMTITASMSDPSEWSDWNGQRGNSSLAVMEAFTEATHEVEAIGLSFGGECFFETGVTPTSPFTSETFSSTFTK